MGTVFPCPEREINEKNIQICRLRRAMLLREPSNGKQIRDHAPR
jgi:hypothetical protein